MLNFQSAELNEVPVLEPVGSLTVNPPIAFLGANLVDNDGDVVDGDFSPGETTLREAIMNAAPGSTIHFDPIIADSTITLVLGELLLTNDVTIDGEDNNITVSGGNATTVFTISPGVTAVLDSLTILDGNGLNSFNPSFGGAIHNRGDLTVTNSTVKDSSTPSGGGGIFNFTGTLTIDSSLITNNVGNNQGGGVNNENGTVHVINSTISGNTANGFGAGAGIVNLSTATTALNLENSTIAENVSNGSGTPGVANAEIFGGTATTELNNTIISGNTGGDGLQIANYSNFGGTTTIDGSGGFNLIGDNSTFDVDDPSNLFDVDPMLDPLEDNGGGTFTHAIKVDSLAFNAGDPSFTPPPDFDQRGDGFDRVGAGQIDIGAFELGNSPGIIIFGNQLLGTPNEDVILGTDNNELIIGNSSDDQLFGGAGTDNINGGFGDDLLVGGADNDFLSGEFGDDTLNGAGTTLGVGEIDRLAGGAGSDLFVLGNQIDAFYLGNGDLDFAYIVDFNPNVDTLQLNGAAIDYTTMQTSVLFNNINITGQGIFQGGDLVAILQQSAAVLGAQIFV
jgi:Ca2+-binding RTX toxin-like protein